MSRRGRKIKQEQAKQITWERATSLFGNAAPPQKIWEKQFDHFDEEFRKFAQTPYENMDFGDLWYYYHNLTYMKLQPEVFDYLFPVCLMDWHQSLMRNQQCCRGDAHFHYALTHGDVFSKMMNGRQRLQVFEFFRDSFLERLDAERGFVRSGSTTPAYGWMGRFNDLGHVMSRIDLFWEPWWQLKTPGRAVAALQYCSGLMYPVDQNPLFDPYTPEKGGGGPYLGTTDNSLGGRWLPENVHFLESVLTVDFVVQHIELAVGQLEDQPEVLLARKIQSDLSSCEPLLAIRVKELPLLLSGERLERNRKQRMFPQYDQ